MFDGSFKLFCVVLTIITLYAGIHKYCKNDDATVVSYRPWYMTPHDIYPSVSICITSPFEEENLNALGNSVTSNEYGNFLRGLLKKDELLNIDYKKVSLKPIDYVLGYEIAYRDGTFKMKNYASNSNENADDKDLILPSNRIIMANMICFGIDVLMKKEFLGIGIKIKTDIFHDGIRPSLMNIHKNVRALGVIIHYPKQIFRNKWWKNYWPTRHANSSKNYDISYDVSGLEVVRYRSKKQRCYENFPDYDEESLEDILLSVGCMPPYSASRHNLSMCTEPNQFQEIIKRQSKLWLGDNVRHLPCSGIERVSYAVTEIDVEETQVPYFKISFNFKDLSYKEIKMVRAFDIPSLVGNLGGYIGMFLGYALMTIPQGLKEMGKRIRQWIGKRTETDMVAEMKNEEEVDQNYLKLSKAIDNLQMQFNTLKVKGRIY